ncbi:hypothetical protein EVAR_68409_1 [Eumeta japonica]|uniref:Uncharacterized protein n=1 Tax=Eumeta variegata TaxID=151549 RepID=A0A4C2A481_EUMVA|nr:hypothetical protein EVAR_68409_1 [Eumeta japonica]
MRAPLNNITLHLKIVCKAAPRRLRDISAIYAISCVTEPRLRVARAVGAFPYFWKLLLGFRSIERETEIDPHTHLTRNLFDTLYNVTNELGCVRVPGAERSCGGGAGRHRPNRNGSRARQFLN